MGDKSDILDDLNHAVAAFDLEGDSMASALFGDAHVEITALRDRIAELEAKWEAEAASAASAETAIASLQRDYCSALERAEQAERERDQEAFGRGVAEAERDELREAISDTAMGPKYLGYLDDRRHADFLEGWNAAVGKILRAARGGESDETS